MGFEVLTLVHACSPAYSTPPYALQVVLPLAFPLVPCPLPSLVHCPLRWPVVVWELHRCLRQRLPLWPPLSPLSSPPL